jgi:hypothetical protein
MAISLPLLPDSPDPPTPLFLSSRSHPSLLQLPMEIRLLIQSNLSWPDLLALKHTHPSFYHNPPTTVSQRLSWLLSRGRCGLNFPREKINMRTDADFCRSHEIRTFLERRRWHLDCRRDGSCCLVFDGRSCPTPVGDLATLPKSVKARKNNSLSGSFNLFWVPGLIIVVVLAVLAQYLDFSSPC